MLYSSVAFIINKNLFFFIEEFKKNGNLIIACF